MASTQLVVRENRCALRCRVEEVQEEREVDGSGQVYMTIAELKEQEAQRRAGVPPFTSSHGCCL